MARITMNAVTPIGNRAILRVVSKTIDVGKSLPISQTYFGPDSYGMRFLYPGLIVGLSNDRTQYVPVDSLGSYGVYGTYTYACGIVADFFDLTYQDQVIAPVTRAAVVEQYCYLHQGTLGVVPDDVKSATDMKLIQWD